MTNNSTLLFDGGVPVVVEQGPRWLADLLFAPPGWVQASLVAVAAFVTVGAIYALTRVDISPAVLREVASNLLLAGCIGLATQVSVSLLAVGYFFDVAIGVSGGLAVAELLVRVYDKVSWSIPLRRVDLD